MSTPTLPETVRAVLEDLRGVHSGLLEIRSDLVEHVVEHETDEALVVTLRGVANLTCTLSECVAALSEPEDAEPAQPAKASQEPDTAERRTVGEGGTHDPSGRYDLSTDDGMKAWQAERETLTTTGHVLLTPVDAAEVREHIEMAQAELRSLFWLNDDNDGALVHLGRIASYMQTVALHVRDAREVKP